MRQRSGAVAAQPSGVAIVWWRQTKCDVDSTLSGIRPCRKLFSQELPATERAVRLYLARQLACLNV